MYRLSHSTAGGFRLDVVSSGLYTLPGNLEHMLAFEDEIWGKFLLSSIQFSTKNRTPYFVSHDGQATVYQPKDAMAVHSACGLEADAGL